MNFTVRLPHAGSASLLLRFGAAVVTTSAISFAAAQSTVEIPGSVPDALPQSRVVGSPSGSEMLHLAVSLPPRNAAALESFCESVSDPNSPNYGKFLTPAEVGSTFGATSTNIKAVSDFLKAKGLTISLTAPNGMAILVDGTISKVQSAFGTSVKNYKGPNPLGGAEISFRSNSTPLKVPSSLAGKILNVCGIETYSRPIPRANTQTLTPFLTRSLYKTQSLFTALFRGNGRTVGISNWDGFRLSDAASFISTYALPTPGGGPTSNIQVVPIGGGSGTGPAAGEGDLDIQMALCTAPLATIIVYDGSGANLVNVLTKEATDNKADVISESWGWNINGTTATAAHNQHLAMTAQGITYMAATGDFGTQLEPFSYPNYEPEVLQVGGTVATVNDATGARVSEVGWSGSGGGWSNNAASFNTKPSWQVGTGVPSGINHRLCPDISLHASGAGGAYFFFSGGGKTSADGTSFSSPVFAGSLAACEQKLISQGKLSSFNGKLRMGRIQNLIYSQNGRPDVYIDITSGSNGVLPNGQTANCTAKWDFVTGFGSLDFDAFINSIGSGSGAVMDDPTSVNLFQGTYMAGDLSSLLASDNSYYSLQSYLIDATGNPVTPGNTPTAQVAGFTCDFNIDLSGGTLISLKAIIEGNSNQAGVTGQVYGYNWNTGLYELASSFAIKTTDATSTLNIPSTSFSHFVDGAGNIRLLVRAIVSVRGGRPGLIPSPFLMNIDKMAVSPVVNPPGS